MFVNIMILPPVISLKKQPLHAAGLIREVTVIASRAYFSNQHEIVFAGKCLAPQWNPAP